MSAPSLLARATNLLTRRAGVAGALLLTPIAAVEAQTVFTPVSNGFYTTTSGMPDYEGSFGASISAVALGGGTWVSLWGDSGVRARDTFSYVADGWDGPEVRYRDGLTFAWRGVFDGAVIGDRYDGEGNWVNGDAIAVDYDFTIERSYVGQSIDWEIVFSWNGSTHTLASGSVSGEGTSFGVSGSALGSTPLSWNSTPDFHENTPWTVFLVVKPYSYGFRDYWEVDDTLRVLVPEGAIEFGINGVASAIPEPSTWALIMGGAAIGVVAIRRRGMRRR